MVKNITKISIIRLYLNDYGRKYYLREAASLLGKPHQTIKPYIEQLAKEGMLVKTRRKNLVEYALNSRNSRMRDYLVIAEKERIIERIGRDTLLRTLHDRLYPFFDRLTFIIFGSASAGSSKASDIDLLVLGKKDISPVLEEFEDIYGKKIHKIQADSMEKLTPELVIEIYKKHLIFNNTENILKFFWGEHEKNRLV